MWSIGHYKRDMMENRKNNRYRTLAQAKITNITGVECLLKDLSVTGCCIECTAYLDVQPNIRYQLEIVPEGAANIGPFGLTVKSKWIRAGGYSCEIGFAILESPKGKSFQRYVDYLSWRSSTADKPKADAVV
jgi:hypothetical protein